jgi:hypothetical protein
MSSGVSHTWSCRRQVQRWKPLWECTSSGWVLVWFLRLMLLWWGLGFLRLFSESERDCTEDHENFDTSDIRAHNLLKIYWLSYLEGQRPYMYNLPYAYAYALSDMKRITLVLMHILIQSPSWYMSSFTYKTLDDAETHDPSTHATNIQPITIHTPTGDYLYILALILFSVLWYRMKFATGAHEVTLSWRVAT